MPDAPRPSCQRGSPSVELVENHSPAELGKPGTAVITALNACAMHSSVSPGRYRKQDRRPMPLWIELSAHRARSGQRRGYDPASKREAFIRLGLKFVLLPFYGIDQFRVIQRDPSHLIIQLAVQKGFRHESVSNIEAGFLQYLRSLFTWKHRSCLSSSKMANSGAISASTRLPGIEDVHTLSISKQRIRASIALGKQGNGCPDSASDLLRHTCIQ